MSFFTADVSKASAKVKSELPGRTNEAKYEGEKYATQASNKLDAAVRSSLPFLPQKPILTYSCKQYNKTAAELAKAENKFEDYRKSAGAEAMAKIDAADKKVEQEAAKAKSGISSWFGGK